ncbi:MAG: DNA polymerase I [Desulfurivibrio sp.]|nr:DNA polymerase I [Desulfurivibrio sp.]
MKKPPIYLIDGSAYIHRAYHAISPLTNRDGLPTHAIYGFTTTLLRVIREGEARHLAVVFDARGPNFRHQLYPQYKANRPAMPEDLACQLPYIKEIVAAYRITSLEQEGYEADDLIAAASRRLATAGHRVVIVSGDKDLLQLVAPNITFWDPMGDRLLDAEAVEAKYQLPPAQLLDYFALIGDSSDNIPGVPGVGPKTAVKLIKEFGDLDQLFANLEQVSAPKLRRKLAEHRDKALLARELIRLKDDLDTPATPEDYHHPEPDRGKLRQLFSQLDFSRLLQSEAAAEELDDSGFQMLTAADQLPAISEQLRAAGGLVIDTETTSLNALQAELVGISLCPLPAAAAAASQSTPAWPAWYLPIGHRLADGSPAPGQLSLTTVQQHLAPLLGDPQLLKLGHNLKYDLQILKNHNLEPATPLADTMIASYLLDPGRRSHKLDDLSSDLLERQLTSFAEVSAGDRRPEAFAYVEPAAACRYSCQDVAATRLLWELFAPQLGQLGQDSLFHEVEMALLPILARMERLGILVDPAVLDELEQEFGRELARLEEKIASLAGEPFNINSPRQLGEVLYERLKLPHGRKTKGKTGYSTDYRELERLAAYHDLPAAVISHRNLSKLKSTYVDKLATLIDPADGRVHTTFNQTVTATGRLSSSNPNLQNIPIRTPEGRRLRAAFVAAPEHLFLAADYSQIDLRVLAHYSGDPVLQEAFADNQDIHARTAAEIFRVNQGLVSADMRRVAKTINFGIIYGMSAFGLAEQLHCSRKEAQTFIDRYFELYQGVHRFMQEIVEQARRDGWVGTLLMRRRPLPEINSNNKMRREFAERTAINTPIQGTAADIIKLAAIACDRALKKAGRRSEALLQIHDELIFEVPEKELAEVGPLVRQAMEGVMELAVPLTVNLKNGPNLSEIEG